MLPGVRASVRPTPGAWNPLSTRLTRRFSTRDSCPTHSSSHEPDPEVRPRRRRLRALRPGLSPIPDLARVLGRGAPLQHRGPADVPPVVPRRRRAARDAVHGPEVRERHRGPHPHRQQEPDRDRRAFRHHRRSLRRQGQDGGLGQGRARDLGGVVDRRRRAGRSALSRRRQLPRPPRARVAGRHPDSDRDHLEQPVVEGCEVSAGLPLRRRQRSTGLRGVSLVRHGSRLPHAARQASHAEAEPDPPGRALLPRPVPDEQAQGQRQGRASVRSQRRVQGQWHQLPPAAAGPEGREQLPGVDEQDAQVPVRVEGDRAHRQPPVPDAAPAAASERRGQHEFAGGVRRVGGATPGVRVPRAGSRARGPLADRSKLRPRPPEGLLREHPAERARARLDRPREVDEHRLLSR